MTTKLKDSFDARVVRSIAGDLRRAYAPFDEAAFVATCLDGLDTLELTARGWHVADAMHAHLPGPFANAVAVIVASLGGDAARTHELGLTAFRYLPHGCFVAKYGLDDFERSMHAQYELTKRFTAEFSIRPFFVKYPDETYARFVEWARDPDVHVRRLVSEGSRPRLPWAPRLRAFQDDPSRVIALLELLKDDPERYVQRSVANNLNDIAKDHPAVVVDVCERWSIDASPGRQWIVKHALRSLVKSGDRGALAALGVGAAPAVRVTNGRIVSGPVHIGRVARFAFEIESTTETPQELLVDYAVYFMKANGQARAKVFKLRKIALAPGASLTLESTVSFEHLTTRRPYPGRHEIAVLVNGVAYPLVAFDVAP